VEKEANRIGGNHIVGPRILIGGKKGREGEGRRELRKRKVEAKKKIGGGE